MIGCKSCVSSRTKRFLVLSVFVTGGLMVSACDKGYDTTAKSEVIVTTRYDTTVEGQVIVTTSSMPSANAEYTVRLEFEPGKSAILYTSENTQLVGHKRLYGLIPWRVERTYLVKGNKTQPRNAKEVSGDLLVTAPQGTEMWLDVGYVELLPDKEEKGE